MSSPLPVAIEVDLGLLQEGAPGAQRRGPLPLRQERLRVPAAWSGVAAALTVFLDDPAGPAPFVVSVGEAVRRGLPTAARATVMARSPLTGRLSEGQVGGELGRCLGAIADLLVLRGHTTLPAAVLHLDGAGRASLVPCPGLEALPAPRLHPWLQERFGPCASLGLGPAGRAAVPYANLAAGGGAGGEHPSFVGRGGLGAALGSRGLVALCITLPTGTAAGTMGVGVGVGAADREALIQALLASPRLAARAEGGTLELAQALGARGDLRGRGYGDVRPPEVGARISAQARAAARQRRGCRGCPTPCGWVFEAGSAGGGGDSRRTARFSGLYPLGANLGLESFDDALALLATCDDLGLDAKEAGACLALLARAGRTPWGNREAFEARLREVVEGQGQGAAMARGSVALARDLGLEEGSFQAGGDAARPSSNLAEVLGACVAARGGEPMRTFPFLVGDGAPVERIAALIAPLPLPPGAEDARSPVGKGRLVWWHENLIAALDATGFCAFSAAGLLSDGACDLDRLAAWIAPAFPSGQGLLAVGASLVGLHRELAEAWGVTRDGGDGGGPAWARADLARPGMVDEYRALRGLDPEGRLTRAARQSLATAGILELAELPPPRPAPFSPSIAPSPPSPAAGPRREGSVSLRTTGPLARGLGGGAGAGEGAGEAHLTLPLPATLVEVLQAAARRWPAAAGQLLDRGRPLPAVYRRGRRLAPPQRVEEGDRLDLVLVVSGG